MQSSNAAILTHWRSAKDWRELLRLNARFIRGDDATTPYFNNQTKSPSSVHTGMLQLQNYGFLVRYAQPESSNGPAYNPVRKLWEHTSDRAVIHAILPTAFAVPIAKIEALVRKLVDDRENLEVTVLADYKNYPHTPNLGVGFHEQYAAPLDADAVISSRELELFRSTVGIGAKPSTTMGTKTGTTYGRYKEAATKEELETRHWRRDANKQLPYQTVDDVPDGSANNRAFETRLDAAAKARSLEIVLASKKFDSGLELIDYLEMFCIDVGLQPVFEEKEIE